MISYAGDHFQYAVSTQKSYESDRCDLSNLANPHKKLGETNKKKNGSKQNIADCKVSTRKRPAG